MGFDDTEIKAENQKKTLWLYRATSADIYNALAVGTITTMTGLSGWGGFELAGLTIEQHNKKVIKTANKNISTLVAEQNYSKEADALVLEGSYAIKRPIEDDIFGRSNEFGQVKLFKREPFSKLIQEQKQTIAENSHVTYGVGTGAAVVVTAALGFFIGKVIIAGRLGDFYYNMGQNIHKVLHPEKKNRMEPE